MIQSPNESIYTRFDPDSPPFLDETQSLLVYDFLPVFVKEEEDIDDLFDEYTTLLSETSFQPRSSFSYFPERISRSVDDISEQIYSDTASINHLIEEKSATVVVSSRSNDPTSILCFFRQCLSTHISIFRYLCAIVCVFMIIWGVIRQPHYLIKSNAYHVALWVTCFVLVFVQQARDFWDVFHGLNPCTPWTKAYKYFDMAVNVAIILLSYFISYKLCYWRRSRVLVRVKRKILRFIVEESEKRGMEVRIERGIRVNVNNHSNFRTFRDVMPGMTVGGPFDLGLHAPLPRHSSSFESGRDKGTDGTFGAPGQAISSSTRVPVASHSPSLIGHGIHSEGAPWLDVDQEKGAQYTVHHTDSPTVPVSQNRDGEYFHGSPSCSRSLPITRGHGIDRHIGEGKMDVYVVDYNDRSDIRKKRVLTYVDRVVDNPSPHPHGQASDAPISFDRFMNVPSMSHDRTPSFSAFTDHPVESMSQDQPHRGIQRRSLYRSHPVKVLLCPTLIVTTKSQAGMCFNPSNRPRDEESGMESVSDENGDAVSEGHSRADDDSMESSTSDETFGNGTRLSKFFARRKSHSGTDSTIVLSQASHPSLSRTIGSSMDSFDGNKKELNGEDGKSKSVGELTSISSVDTLSDKDLLSLSFSCIDFSFFSSSLFCSYLSHRGLLQSRWQEEQAFIFLFTNNQMSDSTTFNNTELAAFYIYAINQSFSFSDARLRLVWCLAMLFFCVKESEMELRAILGMDVAQSSQISIPFSTKVMIMSILVPFMSGDNLMHHTHSLKYGNADYSNPFSTQLTPNNYEFNTFDVDKTLFPGPTMASTTLNRQLHPNNASRAIDPSTGIILHVDKMHSLVHSTHDRSLAGQSFLMELDYAFTSALVSDWKTRQHLLLLLHEEDDEALFSLFYIISFHRMRAMKFFKYLLIHFDRLKKMKWRSQQNNVITNGPNITSGRLNFQGDDRCPCVMGDKEPVDAERNYHAKKGKTIATIPPAGSENPIQSRPLASGNNALGVPQIDVKAIKSLSSEPSGQSDVDNTLIPPPSNLRLPPHELFTPLSFILLCFSRFALEVLNDETLEGRLLMLAKISRESGQKNTHSKESWWEKERKKSLTTPAKLKQADVERRMYKKPGYGGLKRSNSLYSQHFKKEIVNRSSSISGNSVSAMKKLRTQASDMALSPSKKGRDVSGQEMSEEEDEFDQFEAEFDVYCGYLMSSNGNPSPKLLDSISNTKVASYSFNTFKPRSLLAVSTTIIIALIVAVIVVFLLLFFSPIYKSLIQLFNINSFLSLTDISTMSLIFSSVGMDIVIDAKNEEITGLFDSSTIWTSDLSIHSEAMDSDLQFFKRAIVSLISSINNSFVTKNLSFATSSSINDSPGIYVSLYELFFSAIKPNVSVGSNLLPYEPEIHPVSLLSLFMSMADSFYSTLDHIETETAAQIE
ncbi:hypothetical protein ADUPG1_009584, partial [Aduncisulcus paluster]